MKTNIIEQLKIIFNGGQVKRYHTRPTIHGQNNAEHQYIVTSIVCLLNPNVSAQVIRNALWHDIYEYETGDMPWAIKRRHPHIKQAIMEIEEKSIKKYGLSVRQTPLEHAILKLAEYFECMLFCIEQRRMGNKEFEQSVIDCIDQINLLNLFVSKKNRSIYNRSSILLDALIREAQKCQS